MGGHFKTSWNWKLSDINIQKQVASATKSCNRGAEQSDSLINQITTMWPLTERGKRNRFSTILKGPTSNCNTLVVSQIAPYPLQCTTSDHLGCNTHWSANWEGTETLRLKMLPKWLPGSTRTWVQAFKSWHQTEDISWENSGSCHPLHSTLMRRQICIKCASLARLLVLKYRYEQDHFTEIHSNSHKPNTTFNKQAFSQQRLHFIVIGSRYSRFSQLNKNKGIDWVMFIRQNNLDESFSFSVLEMLLHCWI